MVKHLVYSVPLTPRFGFDFQLNGYWALTKKTQEAILYLLYLFINVYRENGQWNRCRLGGYEA